MKLFLQKLSLLFVFILGFSADGAFAKNKTQEHYVIDTTHSNINFKVRHFLTNVSGSFEHFDGDIWLNRQDISKSYVEARVYPTTIDTNDDERDKDLKSDNFFNVQEHPVITFKSTEWKTARSSKQEFIIKGELTMLGQTHPITLYAKLVGFGQNNRGGYLCGWEIMSNLNRKTWGMSYGGAAIGNEVSIEIEIEAIRKPH